MHYLAYHERSLAAFAETIPAASTPVERSRATFVVVAGTDDALWPSERFAMSLAERLDSDTESKVYRFCLDQHLRFE